MCLPAWLHWERDIMVILLNNAGQSGDCICFKSTQLLNLKQQKPKQTNKKTQTLSAPKWNFWALLTQPHSPAWPWVFQLGPPLGLHPGLSLSPVEVPGTPWLPCSWLGEGTGPGFQAVPCCPSPCSALTENRVILRPYVCRVGCFKLFKQVFKHLDSHKTCLATKCCLTVGYSRSLFHWGPMYLAASGKWNSF